MYKKHVIVLGSARSGTSWLSESLAKPFRYRMLFEPEHDKKTSMGHLIADHYFGKHNAAPLEALKYLHKVFQNRVDCNWIAQNSNRKYKRHLWPFVPKKFIIKFVRFNLSGQFLKEVYEIPIVHIIRNPIETIKSQKRVRFPWLFDFSYFLKQAHLVHLVQTEFNYDLKKINEKSETEKLAVRWCIENVIPLQINTIPKSNYWVIKHEDLHDDINIFKNLCQKLNLEVLESIREEYTRPSTKTHPKSNIHEQRDQREFLNKEEEVEVVNILKQFKQELYALAY